MRIHRLSATVGAGVLAVALAACSAPDPEESGSSGAPTESKGAIAWSYPSQDVAVWADQLALMRPIIEQAGYEFLTDDPGFNAQTQVSDWQSWVARGDVKAMGGFPFDVDTIIPVTNEAVAAGIPVIGYIVEWPGVAAATLASAYDSGFALGEAAGKWVEETHGTEQVGVAMLGEFGSPFGQEQAEGYRAGLAETAAKVKITELQTVDRNEGYGQAQSQLAADPDTRVWLTVGGDMGLGARQAIIDSGIAADDPEWFVGSTDVTDEVLDLIATGDDIWRTSFVAPASALAESNANLLIAAAEGRELKTVSIPGEQVTADNVDRFRAP